MNSFLKKIFFICSSFCFFLFYAKAQTPDFSEIIQIHLWSELDAYPELEEAHNTDSEIFEYSANRIKNLAPFLINGMVYGWNFKYTPSDKLRSVAESLEIQNISEIDFQKNPITYEKSWIQDNFVHIWAKYTRTENQKKSFSAWKNINTKKTNGIGNASVKLGFNGITYATKDAIRNGIRNFYRPIIKNKPKEISGKIIITSEPKIGIVQGQYVVKLDFFLETDRIVKYTMF